MTKKVFLGGTCGNSTWREELIPMLKVDYFNPVVEEWTEEDKEIELQQRFECDYLLYVITSEMEGVFSIAELIDDSNKQPEKTFICILQDGFSKNQLNSLKSVEDMARGNGAKICYDLENVAAGLAELSLSQSESEAIRNSHFLRF